MRGDGGGRKQAGRVPTCSSTGSSGSAGFAAACAATAAGRAAAGAAGAGRALGAPGPCTGAAACMIAGLLYTWRDPCRGVERLAAVQGGRGQEGAGGARIGQRHGACAVANIAQLRPPFASPGQHVTACGTRLVSKLHFNSSLRLGTRPMDGARPRPPETPVPLCVRHCETMRNKWETAAERDGRNGLAPHRGLAGRRSHACTLAEPRLPFGHGCRRLSAPAAGQVGAWSTMVGATKQKEGEGDSRKKKSCPR